MLNKLIKLIRNGLIHYVKQVEREHCLVANNLTKEYVQGSTYLSAHRKESILSIMAFCEEGERTLMSPPELAQKVLNYVNSINSSLGVVFHYHSRLQRIMIDAVATYDPELIRYNGHAVVFIEHNLDELSSSRQSQSEDTMPVHQLHEFIELIMSLREDNKTLKERLDRQDELFRELRAENLILRESLGRAQLELIRIGDLNSLTNREYISISMVNRS